MVGTVNQTFNLYDYQLPTFSGIPAAQTVSRGTAITPISITYAGYPTPSVKVADLPKGLTYSVDTADETVTISGTPASNAVSVTTELSAKSKAGTVVGSIAFTVNP